MQPDQRTRSTDPASGPGPQETGGPAGRLAARRRRGRGGPSTSAVGAPLPEGSAATPTSSATGSSAAGSGAASGSGTASAAASGAASASEVTATVSSGIS